LTRQKEKNAATRILVPVAGTLVFLVLYIIAALSYPGGSQADKNSVGFSWLNNYWCNLLAENAINGQPNGARPIAISGMFVLCLSLSLFWWLLPAYINTGKWGTVIIKVCGVGAMATAFFLFTGIHHDLIVNLASSFGVVASFVTMLTLYRKSWHRLFAFGLLNMALVVVNNYLYHAEGMIVYLPLVQKISFATFLAWICAISIRSYTGSLRKNIPD
jgi:hypothetical protein